MSGVDASDSKAGGEQGGTRAVSQLPRPLHHQPLGDVVPHDGRPRAAAGDEEVDHLLGRAAEVDGAAPEEHQGAVEQRKALAAGGVCRAGGGWERGGCGPRSNCAKHWLLGESEERGEVGRGVGVVRGPTAQSAGPPRAGRCAAGARESAARRPAGSRMVAAMVVPSWQRLLTSSITSLDVKLSRPAQVGGEGKGKQPHREPVPAAPPPQRAPAGRCVAGQRSRCRARARRAARWRAPEVGSSRSSTRACVSSATPTLTRFAWPPLMPRRSAQPMRVSLGRRRRPRREGARGDAAGLPALRCSWRGACHKPRCSVTGPAG